MDVHGLVKELVGVTCQCGKTKATNQTFCRSCYFSLPDGIRLKLYNGIGNGYEGAYQEAVTLLEKDG